MFARGVMLISFLSLAWIASAQQTPPDFVPTNTVNQKKIKPKEVVPKEKHYAKLYVKKPKGTLYGNPCAIDMTHRMGFEYVVQSKGMMQSKTKVGTILNNTGVKTKLVLTRTPFWKMILNKKLQDCRRDTRDGIG
jgi:hypothetical protein